MRSRDPDRPSTFTEQARRTQIVACAIDVIAEIGYSRASIRKIAERVGVAMSVVLYHFENKDELVGAIVTSAYQSAVAAVVPPVDAAPTATGQLRAYIRATAAYIASHATQFMAMLDIGLSYRTATGQRLDSLDVDQELLADLAKLDLEAILRRGQDEGEFRPLDARSVAMAVRGALNGVVLEIARDRQFDVLAYGEELVTVFDMATRR